MSTKRSVPLVIGISVALSMPAWGYNWNLFMHVFGAILFMGNLIVTAAWVSSAKGTGSAATLNFAARGIIKTDIFFTTPGAVLLLLNGGLIGTEWFKMGASWLMLGATLFLVSGIIWLVMLIPLQKKLVAATATEELSDTAIQLVKKWFRFGGIATMLAFVALVLMVLKPTLW